MNEEYQKHIVLIVFSLMGIIYGTTILQKFFYILQKEALPKLGLGYIPYYYGPYSRQLSDLSNSLQRDGLVIEKTKVWVRKPICRKYMLTSSGKKLAATHLESADPKLLKKIKKYVEKFKGITPSQILKHVYEEYPDMTRNSVLLTPADGTTGGGRYSIDSRSN